MEKAALRRVRECRVYEIQGKKALQSAVVYRYSLDTVASAGLKVDFWDAKRWHSVASGWI